MRVKLSGNTANFSGASRQLLGLQGVRYELCGVWVFGGIGVLLTCVTHPVFGWECAGCYEAIDQWDVMPELLPFGRIAARTIA